MLFFNKPKQLLTLNDLIEVSVTPVRLWMIQTDWLILEFYYFKLFGQTFLANEFIALTSVTD